MIGAPVKKSVVAHIYDWCTREEVSCCSHIMTGAPVKKSVVAHIYDWCTREEVGCCSHI